MSHSKKHTANASSLELELYFLIAKLLESGPLKKTYNALKEELEEHELLPKRVDWRGHEHYRSYENLVQAHRHISPSHLLNICQRICPLVDQEIPPHVKGVISMLGAGSQSILRTKEDMKHTLWSLRTHTTLKHRVPLLSPTNMRVPNIVKVTMAREMCGVASVRHVRPASCYGKISQLSKALGHLSAVYCVLFDRTGDFIITGADDHLVKVWSSVSGRLLATLRGHSAEITDMAISFDNRLIACGSCDKTVRVWNLKTMAPVAVLHAHTGMVTSIEFCPSPRSDFRHLASTGSDGCVCFWSWNTKTMQFNPKPTKFIEKSRAGAQMLCSSFSPGGIFLATGNSDHVVRIYSYNFDAYEKIAELDVHGDRVDSIQYCNRGTRFVSGSKDGTARIWRYERQNWVAIVLHMSTQTNSIYSDDLPTSNKPRVSMVSWSLDDQFVITAVTDCSIKVWNSLSGALVHTLRGHTDEAFVLEKNPVDGRMLLSAGHDGLIIVWDIVTGTLVKTFTNEIQGQGHGAVFDCKWAPHGLGFAATDSHGFMRYFSFGSSDAYKAIPEEVFFHTDYRPLMRDSNHYVLDEQTQQPPHLMPPAFLVDMDGGPHAVRYQRLVPGREKYPDQYQRPQIGVTPSGDREVLDQSVAELPASEPATPEASASSSRQDDPDILDHMIVRLQREQDERITAAGGDPSLLSPDADHSYATLFSGTSEASTSAATASHSSTRTNRGLFTTSVYLNNRICIKPLLKSTVKKAEKLRNAYMDQEIKGFTIERKKKPVLPSEESSDSTDHVKTRHHKTTKARTTRSGESTVNEERAANRLTTRALYDTEEEDEGDDEGALDIPSDEGWCSSDSSTEYSDWAADGDTVLQPPKRRSERKVRRRRYGSSEEQPEDEETEIDEEAETASDHDSQHSGPAQRRPKRVVRKPKPPPRRKKRESRRQRQKREVMEQQVDVTELADDFRPPEWLSDPIPRKTPYFPQMGDEVIYLRQGHELYVQAVHRMDVYKIDPGSGQPWHKRPSLREQELVKVVGIKYEFKPGSKGVRLVCLKLASIDPETSKLHGWSFTIKYHDMPDVVDFLVLRQAYNNAVSNKWKVGRRFRSMIDGAWWFGKIHSHTPSQDMFPDSLFLCYFVKWDNGEEEKMSPWDFEPIDEQNLPPIKGASVPLTSTEIKSLMYHPLETEWPPHGRDEECDRIIQGLEQIMELSVSEQFLAPVDLNAFPLYAMVVEYPIDMSLIKARLENRFYRRVTSIQYDVRYIETNTETFNQPGSEIVQKAKLVAELCLRLISDPDCYDIMPVYNVLAKDTEFTLAAGKDSDTESDHSGPSRRSNRRRLSMRRPSKSSTSGPDAWRESVQELMLIMVDHEDSVPFRNAVDPVDYPDYFDRIDHPMDLGTISNHLSENAYDNPLDFCKDVRLVFTNSKAYNTNKRSRIYAMTLRLSFMFEDRIEPILKQWRAAVKESKQKSSSRLPSKVHKLKLNAQRSLRGSPSKAEAGSSSKSPSKTRTSSKGRVKEELVLGNAVGTFKFVVKRQRLFSDSADEDNEADDSYADAGSSSPVKPETRFKQEPEEDDDDDETEVDSEYEEKPCKPSRMKNHPPQSSSRRLANGASARYTTRTKTGSVKRKHYDHLSDSEPEPSPLKQRRISPKSREKSETEEDECNVRGRGGSSRKPAQVHSKARKLNGSRYEDDPDESLSESGDSVEKSEESESNSGSDTDNGSENDFEQSRRTVRTKRSSFKGASQARHKGKGRRITNGRNKGKSSSSSSFRPRRGASHKNYYCEDYEDEEEEDEVEEEEQYSRPKSGRRSTRNQGRQAIRYDENTDEDQYSTSPRVVGVSSRGRVRKPRGFFDDS